MSITLQGIEGEKKARLFLQDIVKTKSMFQLDWLFEYRGSYFCLEVKNKELFKPPPFYGHGLDVRQILTRLKFYKKTGIRCLFLVFDSNNTYYQWLDVLDNTRHFTTINNIRIYNIDYFKKI
jgi:hypothetical protein